MFIYPAIYKTNIYFSQDLHCLFYYTPTDKIIKSFDISYSDIFEIYIMDTQMLEAINYIRNVSKKKVTIDKIVTYLNNASASNWDKESIETNLKEIETKGIINENYKPLVTDFVEETQISSQIDDFTNSDTEKMIIPETQVTPRINKETHTPISGKAEIESLQDFQKTILSEMKNMRSFLETVDQRVIQIEDIVIGSNKSKTL